MLFVHAFVEADASVAGSAYSPAAMIVCAVARPLAGAASTVPTSGRA
jgi:hypothetical protein